MVTFLDLFAGCGGFSVGLKRAGLTPVGEVELDAWAVESIQQNFPESRVIEADIRTIDDEVVKSFEGVDVIVGGPPCQGFSVAGGTQFGIEDPRNELVHWFLHWVRTLTPRVAIVENVPNILTKTKGGLTVLDLVESELVPLGYSVTARILNAADFGTPQLRKRAFIVATAPGVDFAFPSPTHGRASDGPDLFGVRLAYTTVGEALSDLPTIEAGQGSNESVPYPGDPFNAYQAEMREGSSGVTNHIAMRHSDRLIERFKVIEPGKSLKDVPIEHGQVAKLTGEKVAKPFKYNNYRLDQNKPALAIPASFQSLFLHPSSHRNLTAREAARIMGFPDSFEFKGKRTTMSWEKHLSQYNQIGNAVCPPVAAALGRSILAALEASTPLTLPLGRTEQSTSSVHHLTRPASLPTIAGVVGTSVGDELTDLGRELLGNQSDVFVSQGFSIPVATLPAALIFAADHSCPVCSPTLAPFCCHAGEMPFLISKDDVSSLCENEQDHGLDYHLRVSFGIEHQVGHLVGEKLAELGLVDLTMIENRRTGRQVRGLRLKESQVVPAQLTAHFRAALRLCEVQLSGAA